MTQKDSLLRHIYYTASHYVKWYVFIEFFFSLKKDPHDLFSYNFVKSNIHYFSFFLSLYIAYRD